MNRAGAFDWVEVCVLNRMVIAFLLGSSLLVCVFLEPLFPAISFTHCLLWLDSLTHVDFSVTYVSTAYHTLVVLCYMENEYWLPDRLRVSSVPFFC